MLDVLPRSANSLRKNRGKSKGFLEEEKTTGLTMTQRDRDNMFRGNNNDCRIYVGNLPEDCRERDVEDLFYKYGAIADIRIKRGDASRGRSRGGPNLSYAFVQYDDSRDAEDAIRGRDGYDYDENTLRVEFTRSSQNSNYRRRGGSSYQGRGRGRGVPPRRSSHRVNVKGLPPSGSWQDLKDHMREAGEVLYAEVFGDGSGIVEFAHSDDVRYALKNLDDTDFRSHESENGRITVAEDSHGGRKSYSRSASRSPRRSPRREKQSRRPRSRSRSHSSSHSKSKSRSKSRSKSPVKKSRSRSPRSRSPSRS